MQLGADGTGSPDLPGGDGCPQPGAPPLPDALTSWSSGSPSPPGYTHIPCLSVVSPSLGGTLQALDSCNGFWQDKDMDHSRKLLTFAEGK